MAAKRRVHEIAKALNRTSKELIGILREIGVGVKAANSVVSPEDEAKLRAYLFGIKDRSEEEKRVVIPEMAKPSPGKARLRKKAPRKKKEELEPEVVEAAGKAGVAVAEAVEAAEKKPAKKKAKTEKVIKEPPAQEVKVEQPEAAPQETEVVPAEDEAKAARGKKPPRVIEKDARERVIDEIEEDRGATVPTEALRRLAKSSRTTRPRARRGRRARADRAVRIKRGVPERSRAYARRVKAEPAAEPKVLPKKKIRFRGEQTVGELAIALDVSREKLQEFFKKKGRRDLTPLSILDVGEQAEAAGELGLEAETEPTEPRIEPRRPVVAVLGHVDHGKTTLLDALRNTNVVASESGGITQHIGASVVEGRFGEIVFIDTPGHEVFTQMRARGAQVTDVVVLVVAADDGVMPQTLESISHAKAAHVPIVVAITKMDKPEADPLRVKRGLAEHGVTTEDWGGEVLSAEVSALRGEGLDKLLEAVSLQSEIMELKGDLAARAVGVVVESTLDRGRGAVVTVLVQRGVLKIGDPFVVGKWAGRVRAMFDVDGKKVKEAGPSTPVSVLGAEGVPAAGDILVAVLDYKGARGLAELLSLEPKAEEEIEPAFSLDDWYKQLEEGEKAELNLVVKADVAGSAEALVEHLSRLGSDEVTPKILHAGVGAVNEGDVLLASASRAVLVAYRVGVEAKARKLAQREGVEVRNYDVVYETIEDVRAALEGLLEPEVVTEVVGTAEVRQIFDITSSTRVAGSLVKSGRVFRGARVRILRDGQLLHEGVVSSLRRFRDDVREVQQGLECGIIISGFAEVEVGDVIEVLEERKIARRLERK
ncbi:MAG: translation initiation factor IF-2 [candidate division Zixibacteria bacterium]|nr:translation initiation factor IF-2 [candidate division Zixibacteria bacterium]